MALDFIRKEHYNTEDLIRIVALLRAPGGCPWDQAQTHASIKKNFIEETYEVIEAINRQSTAGLQEELGDVLLQVALHAQMEAEAGRFDFNDVADGICKKLIFRHPHVFGDVKAENTEDALASWDAAKLKEKGMKKVSQSMVSIPRELPALMRAQKVQHKAAKQGFDWPDRSGAMPQTVPAASGTPENPRLALCCPASAHSPDDSGTVGNIRISRRPSRFPARRAYQSHAQCRAHRQ